MVRKKTPNNLNLRSTLPKFLRVTECKLLWNQWFGASQNKAFTSISVLVLGSTRIENTSYWIKHPKQLMRSTSKPSKRTHFLLHVSNRGEDKKSIITPLCHPVVTLHIYWNACVQSFFVFSPLKLLYSGLFGIASE